MEHPNERQLYWKGFHQRELCKVQGCALCIVRHASQLGITGIRHQSVSVRLLVVGRWSLIVDLRLSRTIITYLCNH